MHDSYIRLRSNMMQKYGTLICGTGPSLDVLKDQRLVDVLTKRFNIFCVNTAHHFFRDIDALFIGPRCDYAKTARPEHFAGKRILYLFGDGGNAPMVKAETFMQVSLGVRHTDDITTDITGVLPFGPTTILDLAIPTAMFCCAKRVYLLGAEYSATARRERFAADAMYRTKECARDDEMVRAQKKWATWAGYFAANCVSVVNFSPISELSFPKMDVYDYCGIQREGTA